MIPFRRYRFSVLLFVVVLCCCERVSAEKKFDFNTRCQSAYEAILQLRLAEGARLLMEERRADPDNLIPVLLDNYIDFFQLFFNEDPAFFKLHKPDYARRMELINSGPRTSPYYLFSKSVLHFQWAAILVKFGNTWDAGWAFRRSFLQASENARAHPEFSPAQIHLGAMQVAAGTIPDGYRWLSNLLGIRGSVREGLQRLNAFISRSDRTSRIFRNEAIFYYLYLKFYIENDKLGVFQFIDRNDLDLRNNHLFAYLAANLSINNQQAARGLAIIRDRNVSPGYLETPVWDLETGYAKLQHLEPDAGIHFERFLKNFRGKFYVKDAWQKLSWSYYLAGNADAAEKARVKLLVVGSTDAEADKQAQHEAETNRWPNPLLLRARLLNDGGYHREALKLLQGYTSERFKDIVDKLEFSYRVGRIYDDLGLRSQALQFYGETIRAGEFRKEYYAARAALQTAFLYEKSGDCRQASAWFNRCIAMKPGEYKNSLDQRAKAGLLRCRMEKESG